MTRTVILAQSGWGKSYATQDDTERNVENVDRVIVLDYKDEYRGLAKGGLARWAGIGRAEAQMSVEAVRRFLDENPRVVLARAVPQAEWQEFVAAVAEAVQDLDGTALVVVDEAHFVAPQRTGYPDAIEWLATTGRGNGVSSTWVSQRPANLDETPIAQADARFIGGFTSDADLSKVGSVVPYNVDVHNPMLDELPSTSRWSKPVQKWEEDGTTVGSEWIYSTTAGEIERVDSREWEMSTTHYGGEDVDLDRPV